jgi:cytidyltransferase-like protein
MTAPATRVYVDMVADLFHHGHVELLRRARDLGDHLIVGVHDDETVASYKRSPIMTMEERVRVVAACRYVDEVLPNAPLILGADWLERHRIDLVVHGDDFSEEALSTLYRVPIERGMLRVLPYTPTISTTSILSRISERVCPDANGAAGRQR